MYSHSHALTKWDPGESRVGSELGSGICRPLIHVKHMRPGSVIVDVAIDQGGICETSRPTSHSNPLYVEHGVVHCCVPNMPSAVARTATQALTLVDKDLRAALIRDAGLRDGLQVHAGSVTHAGLAQDTGRAYVDLLTAMA